MLVVNLSFSGQPDEVEEAVKYVSSRFKIDVPYDPTKVEDFVVRVEDSEPKVVEPAPKVVEPAPKVEEPEEEPAKEAYIKSIDLPTVRDILVQFKEHRGKEALVALLHEYGAKNLKDIDEKHYLSLANRAKKEMF